MSWLTITSDAVKTRLTGAEVSALQTSSLAEGQTDPLPEIVSQVCDEVRGYISASGCSLGAAGTIPQKLLSATLAIIRYRLCTRLPVKSLLTDARVEENNAAIRLLEQVAARKFLVEEPTVLSTEAESVPSPRMDNSRPHVFAPDSQEGV